MPAKKDTKPNDEHEAHTIPTPTEVSDKTDGLHISMPVVCNIVKMAALQVDGVYSVGGKFADGIWETLGAKKSDRSVEVTEDEAGNYIIEIHIEMRFGVEIASTADVVQESIRAQVERMTSKGVAKIDVFVDGVRMETVEDAPASKADDWDQPHTD